MPVTMNLVRVQTMLGDRVGREIFMYSITLKPAEDSADDPPRLCRGARRWPGMAVPDRRASRTPSTCAARSGFMYADPVGGRRHVQPHRHAPLRRRTADAVGRMPRHGQPGAHRAIDHVGLRIERRAAMRILALSGATFVAFALALLARRRPARSSPS